MRYVVYSICVLIRIRIPGKGSRYYKQPGLSNKEQVWMYHYRTGTDMDMGTETSPANPGSLAAVEFSGNA